MTLQLYEQQKENRTWLVAQWMGSPPANAGATGSSPGVGGSHALRNSQSQAPQTPPQSPRATTTEPVCLHTEPMHPEHALCKKEPRHCRKEQPPLATTTESPCRAVKTQHSQRKKKHIYALVYCTGLYLSGLLHSV